MKSNPGLMLVVLSSMVLIAALGFVTPEHDKRATSKVIEHHSLHPPHLRSSATMDDIPFWSYQGATVVTDNYIRLTPDKQSTVGSIWNTQPLDLPAWEMVLGFRVHSKSGFGADGMALWIVDNIPVNKGSLFGHPTEFHGLGIIFDSYDNDRYRDNPAIHVLYTPVNERKEYNPQQDFRGQSAGNCYFDYRNTPKPALATARLRFQDGTLQLYVSKHSERDEVLCATVNNVELSAGSFFIGLTAETGGISDHHDIHFLHMYPLDGVQYDHDVYNHQPFSHADETSQKTYWKAKTPEEEAEERREREEKAAQEKAEREKRRKEAEENNQREAERRRVNALEKELEEMRKRAADQEAAFQKIKDQREKYAEQQQQPGDSAVDGDDASNAQQADDAAQQDDATAPEASQPVQLEEARQQEPDPAQQRPRVPLRQKAAPLRRQPSGKGPLPPRRK